MKWLLLVFASLIFFSFCNAQEEKKDSSRLLDEVIIRSFEQNKPLRSVASPVELIRLNDFENNPRSSLVAVMNSVPGIRMEERSPGSYRLNIRGSSLRSPFGVRNVKVYYNDLPYTDPFGTTYLNQLGYYNFNSIEIIKGPGSSLYGAGTGGVLMVQSLDNSEKPGIAAEYSAGSFNYRNIYASISLGTEKYLSRASFQRQESDGYRNQSALRRDVHSWSGTFRLDGDRILKASFLYGDLFYETPGALTLAEYQANPKAARPGGGGFPGAEAAKASIRQKTVLT